MKCNQIKYFTNTIDCLKQELESCKCKCHKPTSDTSKTDTNTSTPALQDIKNDVIDVKNDIIDKLNDIKLSKLGKALLGLLIATAGTVAVYNLLSRVMLPEDSDDQLSIEDSEAMESFSEVFEAIKAAEEAIHTNSDATGPFEASPLEYDYTTLEPAISEASLRMHHDSVYQDYVDSLNDALKQYPKTFKFTLPELLLYPDRVPFSIRAAILRHAGGVYNHGLLWKVLGEAYKTEPSGAFLDAINKQFGSFDNLKDILTSASESIDTTGYCWLALNPYGRLLVITTKDELTPIPLRMIPLLPIDVWEHAHYADYKGQKDGYLNALYTIIDWDRVGARYDAAMSVLTHETEETEDDEE